MKISQISPNFTHKLGKAGENQHEEAKSTSKLQQNPNTLSKDLTRAGILGLTLIGATPNLVACTTNVNTAQAPVTSEVQESHDDVETIDQIADNISAISDESNKIVLSDISLTSVPVTEFYFTNDENVTKLTPNEDIPTNENGSIIVTVSEFASSNKDEGTTLDEIINKVYSDALNQYEGEQKTAVFNKIVDETIQANPSLSTFISEELGDDATSYEAISDLNLYSGKSSSDQSLDTRLLTMPTAIVFQVQGEKPENVGFNYSATSYSPALETASVFTGVEDLLEGEFSSLSDSIYSLYGEDISDEAYRDILYAVVNAPENASEFEYVLDKMNFNDIVKTANITDLNRTLEENTSDSMIGLFYPTVTTLRTNAENADLENSDKNGIIYQISPAAVKNGQNDRTITIESKKLDTEMQSGDVYALKDVLQFYSSPDGKGRFATVEDGKLELNYDIEYSDEFAKNILQQVAYANLDIFTAEYTDAKGTYEYGVFDVEDGYDTTDKSLEDIIKHSTINMTRLMDYSFVDYDGESKFEDGVELNLPQFNYRINSCKETKPAAVADESLGLTNGNKVSANKKPQTQNKPSSEVTEDEQLPTETPTETPTTTPTETPTETPTTTPTETPTTTPSQSVDETPSETPSTPDNNTGDSQTPSTPDNNTGDSQTPSTPTDNTGDSQTPSTPTDNTGDSQTPSTPTDNTGDSQTPSTPTDNTGDSQTPSTPTDNNTEGADPDTHEPETDPSLKPGDGSGNGDGSGDDGNVNPDTPPTDNNGGAGDGSGDGSGNDGADELEPNNPSTGDGSDGNDGGAGDNSGNGGTDDNTGNGGTGSDGTGSTPGQDNTGDAGDVDVDTPPSIDDGSDDNSGNGGTDDGNGNGGTDDGNGNTGDGGSNDGADELEPNNPADGSGNGSDGNGGTSGDGTGSDGTGSDGTGSDGTGSDGSDSNDGTGNDGTGSTPGQDNTGNAGDVNPDNPSTGDDSNDSGSDSDNSDNNSGSNDSDSSTTDPDCTGDADDDTYKNENTPGLPAQSGSGSSSSDSSSTDNSSSIDNAKDVTEDNPSTQSLSDDSSSSTITLASNTATEPTSLAGKLTSFLLNKAINKSKTTTTTTDDNGLSLLA